MGHCSKGGPWPRPLRGRRGAAILCGSARRAEAGERPMSAKKPPAPSQDRRSQQALDQFEKGMKALGKRDYERARDHFESLTSSFPEERDLLERARAYLALCARSLEK